MGKKLTKKSNSEQEYAHKNLNHKEYNYLEEDKRINNNSEKNNIINNNFEMPKIKIKIVNKDKEQILTDHRNKVYKIQMNSPIKAVTYNNDYNLNNNPREDEINKINIDNAIFEKQLEEEHKKDIANPQERYNPTKITYKVDDKVKHVEEGITGIVKFVGMDKIAVLWEDGSRERFSKYELNQLSYIDGGESQVSPLTNQMGGTEPLLKSTPILDKPSNPSVEKEIITKKPEKKSELDLLFEQAFDNMEDTYDDIDDANPNKLKEQSLQRQVATLEKKLDDTKIASIKENAINDIIKLMKSKGMITNSEIEKSQRDMIAKMDDTGFESFKNAILSTSGTPKNIEPTEAEKMLQRVKTGGAIIGSFDKSALDSEVSSRDLKSVASESPKLNLDGFKNLQGITKPIQVIAEQKSAHQSMTETIASLDWTILGKM